MTKEVKVDLSVIDEHSLTFLNAPEDLKKWFLRNIGSLPVNKLKDVEGDYSGYVKRLKDKYINSTYDNKGNILSHKDFYGPCKKYTYDDKGNMLFYKNSTGYWEKYTYDDKDNKISYKNPNGCWEKYTYTTNDEYFMQTLNGRTILKVPFIRSN